MTKASYLWRPLSAAIGFSSTSARSAAGLAALCKVAFQRVYWATVIINCLALAWFVISPPT
jgi:hypothetical protein